jgi:hypothetical protein
MSQFVRSTLGVAALAVVLVATPGLALAHSHHWRRVPANVVPPIETLSPPPQMLYPPAKSSAYSDAKRQTRPQSQVPLGYAVPGVTPYEMLPNKP